MVCPMCVAAVVSQAALPVATAIGGAVAAKAALKVRPGAAEKSVSAKQVQAPVAKLATVEIKDARTRSWPRLGVSKVDRQWR
jgi:hypothetical protein